MNGDPAGEFVAAPGATAEAERTRSPRRPLALLGLAVVAGALGLGIYSGIRARTAADTALRQTAAQAAISAVSVVSPKPAAPTREVRLPGTTQAFTDSPIFARTSGYLKRWYFDIGAHVKEGQLLAEIDSPEVDQQLQQARADLETAQANLRQAQITADRWQALLESGSVSKQETDVAVSALSAMRATVDSNAANVRRLEQLQGFEKIYAPFDGVITARNTDIGALIDAGSATSGRELFHMAAIHRPAPDLRRTRAGGARVPRRGVPPLAGRRSPPERFSDTLLASWRWRARRHRPGQGVLRAHQRRLGGEVTRERAPPSDRAAVPTTSRREPSLTSSSTPRARTRSPPSAKSQKSPSYETISLTGMAVPSSPRASASL